LARPRRPGGNGKPQDAGALTGNPFCGKQTGEFIDAGLYLSQPGELTVSRPDPAIYPDAGYWRNGSGATRWEIQWTWTGCGTNTVRLELHNLDR
jgi:hypothetical protein